MRKLHLTLTDPQGMVLQHWTIGRVLEEDFDIEDLSLSNHPECDFYLWGNYNDAAGIGEDIIREGRNWFDNNGEVICDKCGNVAQKHGASFGKDGFLRLNYFCEKCGDGWAKITKIKKAETCPKCNVQATEKRLATAILYTCPKCGDGWEKKE
jgi:hypothetical protein